MRIIAGTFKGRSIRSPKGLPVRPTTDRMRESLFNILGNQYNWPELEVLDLFCGTGIVSLEFVSRGVQTVTSVDRHFKCVQAVKSAVSDLGVRNLKTIKMDVLRYLQQSESTFDIIFLDPPYDMPGIATLVQTIFERNLLRPEGQVILEHRAQLSFDILPQFELSRGYGSSTLSFFTDEVLL